MLIIISSLISVFGIATRIGSGERVWNSWPNPLLVNITAVCFLLMPGILHIEGILPKGPYLPCVSMAGRAFWQDTLDIWHVLLRIPAMKMPATEVTVRLLQKNKRGCTDNIVLLLSMIIYNTLQAQCAVLSMLGTNNYIRDYAIDSLTVHSDREIWI